LTCKEKRKHGQDMEADL